MQSKELGLAIVGSGRIGGLRGRLAAGHPAVRFIAVSDQDPAKAADLAKEIGAQVHSGDNDEIMARPEVNAVIVSTSEGEHLQFLATFCLPSDQLALPRENVLLHFPRRDSGHLFRGVHYQASLA